MPAFRHWHFPVKALSPGFKEKETASHVISGTEDLMTGG
jgi:hypothetical protein